MQETEGLYWGQYLRQIERDQTCQSGVPKYFGWNKLEWFIPSDFQPKFPEFWSEWKARLNSNEVARVSYIQELQEALRMLFIISTCSLLYRSLCYECVTSYCVTNVHAHELRGRGPMIV